MGQIGRGMGPGGTQGRLGGRGRCGGMHMTDERVCSSRIAILNAAHSDTRCLKADQLTCRGWPQCHRLHSAPNGRDRLPSAPWTCCRCWMPSGEAGSCSQPPRAAANAPAFPFEARSPACQFSMAMCGCLDGRWRGAARHPAPPVPLTAGRRQRLTAIRPAFSLIAGMANATSSLRRSWTSSPPGCSEVLPAA